MDVFLLLLFFIASAPPSLSSSQHERLTYQWLHVSPLQEHLSAAAAAKAAPPQLRSAPWRNATKLTLRIFHRDSPSSPLADTHASPEELLLQRLNRDEARAVALSTRARLASLLPQGNGDLQEDNAASPPQKKNGGAADGFSSPVSSGFAEGSGEYFIRLGVGTPPTYTNMVMDTGSDVVWIQCSPCLDCYKQSDPVFNPAASASYRKLSCRAPVCGMLQLHGCGSGGGGQCLYQVAYGDGSFTAGDFAAEVLRLGIGAGGAAARVAMGCGHDNEGLFAGAGGLLGMGGGPLSFPSQLGRRYSKVFSYCLMDRDREGHSTLEFGGRGAMPRGTMYTPMIKNDKLDTFYYVKMNGVGGGGRWRATQGGAFPVGGGGGGGVIVDSGTSVSRLVEAAYGPLRSAFKAATAGGLLFVGGYWPFDTCYDLSGRRSAAARLPTLSLHFLGGAELALPASNYFIPVDSRGTYCLAFASTSGDLSIIGNIQQQGFRVIFDTAAARVGFAPNQC